MLKKVLKRSIFLFCFFLIGSKSYGQWTIPWQIRGEATLDHLATKNGTIKPDILYGTILTNGSLIGQVFIDQKWNNCSFLLFDTEKLIEGYPAKFDVKANALSVKVKNGIKQIEANKIKSIVWLDSVTNIPSYFVNAREYKEGTITLVGLLEVLVDGQLPLLAQSYFVEKELGFFASMISLFEKEKRDKKYEIKKFFYVSNGSSLSKITSRRDLLLSFGDYYWEMEDYMMKQKLDATTQIGLQKVFEYYNAKFERLPDY